MKNLTGILLFVLPALLFAGPNEDLLKAVKAGNAKAVSAALKAGADVNTRTKDKDGDTPLIIAAENGYREIVKILLKAGADVNMKSLDEGDTATQAARDKGYMAIVKILQEAGGH